MTISKPVDTAIAWMSGDYTASDLQLRKAIVREGLSRTTEMTVSFQSKTKDLDLTQFIGRKMIVHLKTEKENTRVFGGICVSVENLGLRAGERQYVAEVRPWFHLLTRTSDCRVFQNLTTQKIVEKILGEYGFKDFAFKLTEEYYERQYCVQYRETDFDFICRLLEQEGIYYFFDTKPGSETPDQLTFCDSRSSHNPVPESDGGKVKFMARSNQDLGREERITEWTSTHTVTTGKVTIDDYEFFKPTAKSAVTETAGKRGFPHDAMEIYDYPGRFRGEAEEPGKPPIETEAKRAKRRSEVRLQAETVRHRTWRAASGVRTMGVGHSFKLADHPHESASREFLVTQATHYVQTDMDVADDPLDYDIGAQNLEIPKPILGYAYAATIEAIDLADPFRAPLRTPWPVIGGLQTAVVVGPKGEEIHTDDYGRIRVQFHWDREGKKDETSSCWVRVVTPWAGRNWGFAAVPRIGEEVVIQFEEGDPSRPICVGMLYNQDNPTFYSKKETSTQIGIRTDSTKGVKDAEAFNELMFNDEKEKELMRVQAQKDHQFLTKNISRIGVGLKDAATLKDYKFKNSKDGSLLQVVKQNYEHEVQEGNHFLFVTKGSQEKTINQNYVTTVEKGDMGVEVQTGNIAVDATEGMIEIEAKQKIVLKVGKSSITLTTSGVTIDAPMVEIKAKGMATLQGKKTDVKALTMLTLKGATTMIN